MLFTSAFVLASGIDSLAKDSAPDADGIVKLNLTKFTNMGFEDEVAEDGMGGWNDHGENNARNFPLFQEVFAGVPFKIINPAENAKTSIVVFKNVRKPDGLEKIEMTVQPATAAKALNILHCTAWGDASKQAGKPIGFLEVTDEAGKTVKFDVLHVNEAAEWWSWGEPTNCINRVKGCQIPAVMGNGYAFVSQYKLPEDFGKVTQVTITGAPKDQVAYWMLIAATLTPTEMLSDAPMAKPEPYHVTDSREWREFRFPSKKGFLKGSILDFTSNIGENRQGKVILRPDGEYVYEDDPEKPIRFMFTSGCPGTAFWLHPSRSKMREAAIQRGQFAFPEFNNVPKDVTEDPKIHARDFANALTDFGYNAVFLVGDGAEGLCFIKGEKDGDMNYNRELLDLRDYTLKCYEDRGVKFVWGAAREDGFWRIPWTSQGDPLSDRNLAKIDPWLPGSEIRDRTEKAMAILFGQKSAYTGTSLMTNPNVLSFLMNNECDFGSFDRFNGIRADFKQEMAKKYGTIEALKKAWGVEDAAWKSFEEMPIDSSCWMRDTSQRGIDYYDYMLKLSKENLAWFDAACRKLGATAPTTSYDMTKDFYRTLAREDAGCVYMHVYQGHPMGKDISQESVLGYANSFFRDMVTAQYVSKPYFMTEANVCFWNQYRYEQAFALNAYAALNGFDGILNFTGISAGAGRSDASNDRAGSFFGSLDPICHATEFLGMHIYRNQAVKKSPVGVRLHFTPEEIRDQKLFRLAPNTIQTKLALVFRFGLETPKTALPMTENEVRIPVVKGSATREEKLFARVIEDASDTSFNLSKFIAEMKAKGLLPKENRTDPEKDIWESCTGELYLDAKNQFGAINTERVQGISALANTKYTALPDFKINQMTKNGTLNVVAVDGQPIKDSKRLTVVYATNALNRNMMFTDKTMRTAISLGDGTGVLYECGQFDVEIKNANAEKLHCWPVSLDGHRGNEIPVQVVDGRVRLLVNVATLPDGPAIYFELAEK